MANHDETMAEIAENKRRIDVHEAVCAERYQGINEKLTRGDKRMQRIEYLIYFLGLAVLIGPTNALHIVESIFK